MRLSRVLVVSATGCALAVASLAWGQENISRARQAQQLMQEHNISLADAIQKVEQECNGRVVSAHVRVLAGVAGAPNPPPGESQTDRPTDGVAQSGQPGAAGGQLQFIVTCFDGNALRTFLVNQQGQTRPAPEDLEREGRQRERDMPAREMQPREFRERDTERQMRQRESDSTRIEERGQRDDLERRDEYQRRPADDWDRRDMGEPTRDREDRRWYDERERGREWGQAERPAGRVILDIEQPAAHATGLRLRAQRFSELEDTDILDPQDRKLGDIEDFAIDPTTGDVKYAVLSYGGVLDVGDKLFAVPYSALHTRNDRTVVLNVPEDRIKDAPGFDKNDWPNMANPAFATEVDTYYRSAGYADGSMRTRTVARTDLTPATRIVRAKEDVVGKKVKGNNDEDLGTIDDLVLDPDRTKVAYAVVAAGGFLGMGETKYAIPWNAISATAPDTYRVNIDRERLREVRGFSDERWPDMTDRNWAITTHRFFNVQPYWETMGAPLPPREQRIREVEFEEDTGELG